MNPEDVKALVDQLLKTGEILATKAFELAMRQIMVKEILDTITFLICFILVFLLTRVLTKKDSDGDPVHYDVDIVVASWIVIAIFSLIGVVNLFYIISYLVNPEWYAVSLLLGQFNFR